jgi:hypothetical protein
VPIPANPTFAVVDKPVALEEYTVVFQAKQLEAVAGFADLPRLHSGAIRTESLWLCRLLVLHVDTSAVEGLALTSQAGRLEVAQTHSAARAHSARYSIIVLVFHTNTFVG